MQASALIALILDAAALILCLFICWLVCQNAVQPPNYDLFDLLYGNRL